MIVGYLLSCISIAQAVHCFVHVVKPVPNRFRVVKLVVPCQTSLALELYIYICVCADITYFVHHIIFVLASKSSLVLVWCQRWTGYYCYRRANCTLFAICSTVMAGRHIRGRGVDEMQHG